MKKHTSTLRILVLAIIAMPWYAVLSEEFPQKEIIIRAYRNEMLGFLNVAREQWDQVLADDPQNKYALLAIKRFKYRDERNANIGWYKLRLASLNENLDILEHRDTEIQEMLDDRTRRIETLEQNAREARKKGNFSNTSRMRYLWHRKADHLQARANTLKKEWHYYNGLIMDIQQNLSKLQTDIRELEKQQMAAWIEYPPIKMPPPPFTQTPTAENNASDAVIRCVDGVYKNY